MLQLITSFLLLFHPFYVSVTEIKHNSKSKSLEVSCRMFFDDVENAINKQYHVKLDINKLSDKKVIDQYLGDYIRKHLKISADGKMLNLSCVGFEIQEDAAWVYLEVKNIEKVNKISVQDNLLFEQHLEQINMIHVIVDGNRKSTKLDNPDDRASFVF